MTSADHRVDEPLDNRPPTEKPWHDVPGAYSIRITYEANIPCSLCGEITGSGPMGHHRSSQVCDRCLSLGDGELGLILELISEARLWSVDLRDRPFAELHFSESFIECLYRFAVAAERWGPARKFKGTSEATS